MKKQELEDINYLIDSIVNDNSVPRNIKRTVSEAKETVNNVKDPVVDLTSAIYLLEEVLNDVNMPFHTRTDIMSITSELERIKEFLFIR